MSADDLNARIDALEARVDELTKETMSDRADSLRARLEELEVRANLLAMDTRDEALPMLEALRNSMLDARSLLDQARSGAGNTLESTSQRFAEVVDDLRARLEDASQRIRPKSD